MALLATAVVQRIMLNEDGLLRIYGEMTPTGRWESKEFESGPFNPSDSEAVLWSGVTDAVKVQVTREWGIVFGVQDTVDLYHPNRRSG